LTSGCNLPTGTRQLRRWQQAPLNIACHLELAASKLLFHEFVQLQTLEKLAPSLGAPRCHPHVVATDSSEKAV
jgi:hypothetical protein